MAVTKITGAGLGLPNADGNALGGTSNEWSDLYLADSGVIYLGNDQDVTLTHVADTGVLLNSSRKIQFGDSASFIHQSSDGVLTIDGEATIDLNASTAVLVSNDLKLNSDSAVLTFGADNDVTVTHVADTGLTVKNTHTSGNSGIGAVLTLQTGDTDVADGNILGHIKFQAPDEGQGTDAILVAAAIAAESEGDFSSSNNATSLVFQTGASEAATTKMTLSSAGLLTVTDDIVFKDGGTIGVTSATDAMTVSSAGIVTFKDDILIKDGGTIGVATTADALTLSSAGLLTVKDDLIIKDGGTIGGSADADLLTLGDGVLTVTGKLKLADAGYVDISTPLLAGADHTYTGLTAQMLAGGAISAFELVCIHTTTQEVLKADASAYATARVIGIAPAAISDTATGTILLHGFIRDDTWNWTTGSTLYASETAGAMTHTAPTTDGAFVQAVGIALEPDVVYFNPSPDIIEHA